ncbi:MAG TPA: hypothetical protein VHR47_04910 [Bacillota bacterium]|nr:hypothetical protein [Bacillota bacterium]
MEAALQYKIGDSQWKLLWREQTGDYPDDSLENLWANYAELNWTHRFKQHKTKIALSGSQHEQGDGVTENQGKIDWRETFYFAKSTLSLHSYLERRDGTSWIEDIYVLDKEQTEDWKIDTESGWGVDLNWRREIGLHRQWKLGGYFHNNYTKDSWGVHTEWDCYVWGNWRLQLYLRGSGSDDRDNPAGAWLKMTYYF